MRLPKRRAPGRAGVSDLMDSILTACTVVLLVASPGGLAALIAGLHVGLRVGDILVFKPESGLTGGLPVTATRTGLTVAADPTCMLDPATMAHGGGSLVVETKSLIQPQYRVHWAGSQTSQGAADCGRSADLTVSGMDLQALVSAIGGFTFNSRGNVL